MNHTSPFFSVIIATYNRADLILTAIQSVTSQSFKNFEIIIVDDGGVDNTAELISTLRDKRIKYYKQNNAGPAAARNTGATLAGGEFFVFLDSDDWISTDFLNHFFNALSQRHVKLALGFIKYSKEDGSILRTVVPYKTDTTFSYGICGSFAISANLFNAIGGYDSMLTYSENTDLFLRLELGKNVSASEIELVPAAGVIIGPVVRQERSMKYTAKKYKSMRHFMEKHKVFFDSSPKYFAIFKNIYVICAIQNEDFDEAKKALKEMIARNGFNLRTYALYMMVHFPFLAKIYYRLR